MAELNTGDQSPISAPSSLLPSSDHQISGLLSIKPTALHLENHADLALPDQVITAHTEIAHDEILLPASREIAQSECKLHDINIMRDPSRQDEPVINDQLASIILQNDQDQERKCGPLKKSKWEGRSYSPQEGEEEEGKGESACVTPTAREQRITQEILICPPPPCKKRKRDAMASSSSSSNLQYLHPVAAEQAHAAANLQLVVNPPDLHTFPACIRALFHPN